MQILQSPMHLLDEGFFCDWSPPSIFFFSLQWDIITYYEIPHFKMYHSVSFSMFKKLCNHRCHVIPEYLHHYKQTNTTLVPVCSHFHAPPKSIHWHLFTFCLWIFLFQTFHISRIIELVVFCTRLFHKTFFQVSFML